MALKCMDFGTAVQWLRSHFSQNHGIWNLLVGKDLKIGLDQSPGFPTYGTGPERLNDWVKITELSGARASLE